MLKLMEYLIQEIYMNALKILMWLQCDFLSSHGYNYVVTNKCLTSMGRKGVPTIAMIHSARLDERIKE